VSSIQPLSTSRVTNALTRRRLTAQIQSDQADLFRLQNQLSSGYRVFLPSDDAAASQRAIVLQRTIERKEHSATTLAGTTRALSNTESTLQGVADTLIDLNGDALEVVGTITSQTQRDAIIGRIDAALNSLTTTGNAQFVGNYVFAGGTTSAAPYQRNADYIEYRGGELNSQAYVDIGALVDTNVPGDSALGGLSESIRGTADLNPQLAWSTPVSSLNGGAGVSPRGAVEVRFRPTDVNQPTTSAVIDLGKASTVGDLARLIEAGAPAGSGLVVGLSGGSLTLSTPNGGVTIGDVAGGRTAVELGILTTGNPAPDVTGTNLQPRLGVTDSLSDLLGTKARGRLALGGANNDLVVTARANGAAYNNLTIEVVDGAIAGAESAVYTPGTNTLTVTISAGNTTAATVAATINAAGLPFEVQTDYRDATSSALQGAGLVPVGVYTGTTGAQGAGRSLDLASGLRVSNGSSSVVVNTGSARTVEDVLNLLNEPSLGLQASINGAGTGIDVRSRRSGAAFTIGENGGTTATDLGIRTYTGASRLEDFNRGVGVFDPSNPNLLRVTTTDRGITTNYDINTAGAVTVDDILSRVSAQTGGAVTAALATTGNGIVLTATAAAVTGVPSAGTATLGPDTLTFTATTAGSAGDRPFTLEVVDSGAGGLATAVVGDVITVDLGGAASTTDAIAAGIASVLSGYTVTSSGTAPVAAAVAVQSAATTGGVTASPAGVDSLAISGNVARQLGFFGEAAESAASTTSTLVAEDRNTLEVDSVFTTLIRMREALQKNDPVALGRELERLDGDINRVTFTRADVGSRLQSLESIHERLKDEDVELRAALSNEIDADAVEVISDLTAKQYQLEASLRLSSQLLQQSILDYI
jgi:flagellin-like hook-associated protein FlgL